MLGPLIAVVPSKRQRYLADQRECASANGLSVRLRPLPEIPPRFKFSPPPELMSYELRIDKRTREPVAVGTYVNAEDGWAAVTVGDSAPEALERLPAGVMVVRIDADLIAAMWDEQGGEEAIASLAEVLGELHQPK